MYKKMGFQYMNFEDDNFTADKERAKEINAYQLQPAILTPYPGTPVYDQMVKENRMVTNNWEWFDMMNVTFLPKNMTPWELQEEFYFTAKRFYDFKSAKTIGKIFGKEYGRRRWGLALMARLGVWGAHVASKIAKGSVYYDLRHYIRGKSSLMQDHPLAELPEKEESEDEEQAHRKGKFHCRRVASEGHFSADQEVLSQKEAELEGQDGQKTRKVS